MFNDKLLNGISHLILKIKFLHIRNGQLGSEFLQSLFLMNTVEDFSPSLYEK